jgi:uncharacterized protein YfaS (alpha-2-macroglobulin family)
MAYKLALSRDKDYVRTGEAINFMATLTVDSNPVSGATIEFYIYNVFDGVVWRAKIGSATTDSSGVAKLSWTAPFKVTFTNPAGESATFTIPCSEWYFYAYCPAYGVSSTDVRAKVGYWTRLSVSTDKDSYRPYETVKVTVKLEYQSDEGVWSPLPNQTVTISAFGVSKNVTVGTDGTASTTFTAPSASGTYTITASYGGYSPVAVSASVAEVAVKAVASFSASPIAPAVAGALLMALSLLKIR